MNDDSIETIVDGLEPIALIIKENFDSEGLHFFTPTLFPTSCVYEAS